MNLIIRKLLAGGLICLAGCGAAESPTGVDSDKPVSSSLESRDAAVTKASAAVPESRTFTFHYRFRVKDLPAGAGDVVRVWVPCPSTTPHQDITQLERQAPAEVSENAEFEFGNRILYFECPVPASGEFTVDFPYRVTRREVLFPAEAREVSMDPVQRDMFLRADTLVPTTGKPLSLLEGQTLSRDRLSRARQLYDLVDNHVTYKKEGTGWGRGDSEWVCDSRFGNCTDFHSLFISLARSQELPARFEIGLSIPTDKTEGPVAGYHCWAWFFLEDRGWIPVDISEADKHPELKDYYFGRLTADRVLFSTGRDLKLVPASTAEPLNFFIFPHVEVGGKVLPASHVEPQFAFQDEPTN